MKNTECIKKQIKFKALNRRSVVANFDGDAITSDAGLLLLRELEDKFKIIHQFADCFIDNRDKSKIAHSLYELLAQRIYAITAGNEDLNDHDELREDSLYSVLSNKSDISEKIAGKSTLNRLEIKALEEQETNSRYHKIFASKEKIADLFVHLFIQAHKKVPKKIVLDVDATDSPLHGKQEGRFYHGYYKSHCYLPLYITCNDFVLVSKLRMADIDASKGTQEELERVVNIIRKYWPNVKITVRGDSGFCRDNIMNWCETNNVDFIFGIARNKRLENIISEQKEQAKELYEKTGETQRVYSEFMHQPVKKNWARERRVIAKSEHSSKGSNPRFIITSLKSNAKKLYEKVYCQRGDMENRIKEQQLYLFADRMSCSKMNANQLRLWISTIAYTLLHVFRVKCLKGSRMENAQCHTIRNRLIKIGGLIKVSVRRIYLSLSEGFCQKDVFAFAMNKMIGFSPP